MGWVDHGGLIPWVTILLEVQTMMLSRRREALKIVNWLSLSHNRIN